MAKRWRSNRVFITKRKKQRPTTDIMNRSQLLNFFFLDGGVTLNGGNDDSYYRGDIFRRFVFFQSDR